MRRFRSTRLAPTPSGYLHAGNVLSFILTAGLAQRTGADILLRIDDLDRERFRKEYLNDIFETLRFLELPWTIGPKDPSDFLRNFSQHTRMPLYQRRLSQLELDRKVFACKCSRKRISEQSDSAAYPVTCLHTDLPLGTTDVAWRLRPLFGQTYPVAEISGIVRNHMIPDDLQMSVVRRKDGSPSYHLASIVDDVHFGVDLIVRGADLCGATIFQQALAENLGEESFKQVAFIHHPLLEGQDGTKLSKSAGSGSIAHLRRAGLGRSEVLQHLARLAGIDQTVTSWQDLYPDLAVRWIKES